MNYKSIALLLLILSGVIGMNLFSYGIVCAENIDIYTVNAPPLSMPEDNHGIFGDITLEAIKRINGTPVFIDKPWVRGQHDVQILKDKLIYPLTRTKEREPKYTWISEINYVGRSFVTKGEYISSYEDARKKLKKVSVLLGSANHKILETNGFPKEQLETVYDNKQGLKLLRIGRVDAWFNSDLEAKWMVRQEEDTSTKYVFSKTLSSAPVYLAGSKSCDKELVNRLQKAINEMKTDGTFQKIIEKYVGK